ncbi:hypothetical protein [Streptomyces sp. NPDC001070]
MPRDDWRFTTGSAELLDRFIPYPQRLNPDFDRSWIQERPFSRAPSPSRSSPPSTAR